MGSLIKSEIKISINTKQILILMLIILVSTVFTIKKYNDEKAKEDERNLTVASNYTDNTLSTYLYLEDLIKYLQEEKRELKKSNNSEEKIKEIDKEISDLNAEKSVVMTMNFYMDNIKKIYQNNIQNENADIDKNNIEVNKSLYTMNALIFNDIYKKGIIPQNESLLYRDKIEKLYQGLILSKEKIELGEKRNIKATGLSMLNFQMGNQISFIIIGIVVFLNYNIWSKEFEQGHIKTLLIQPYKKSEIYFSRVVVSMLKTLLAISILLILPVIISTIRNKWGEPIANLINSQFINSMFNIAGEKELFLYTKGIDTIGYASYYIPILGTFIIFLMSAIHFISITLKSDFGSILGIFPVLSLLYFPNSYNPFSYFKIKNLLLGEIGIGFTGSIILMLIFIILLNTGSYFLFNRYETT